MGATRERQRWLVRQQIWLPRVWSAWPKAQARTPDKSKRSENQTHAALCLRLGVYGSNCNTWGFIYFINSKTEEVALGECTLTVIV